MKPDIKLTKELAPLIEELLRRAKCNACVVLLLEDLESEGFLLHASNDLISHKELSAFIDKIKDACDFEDIPLR